MKTNRHLLKITVSFLLTLLAYHTAVSQNVAINSTGNMPDSSAILDITSSGKGLLIPRVSLSTSADLSTIVAPATSLLVYNTNAEITGITADGVGYYFNAGNSTSPSWRKVAAGGDIKWDDLRVTLDKGSSSASLEYLNGSSGPQIWYFRNNEGVEAMSFTVQLPHSWKEGTTIYPHLHWLPKSTATGNVEWKLEYTWANYDNETPQVFPAITTSTTVSTGGFIKNAHSITPLTTGNTGIDGTGKKISSILICRLWRNSSNAADTYNDDAGLLFLDFHILVDGFGSRQEYIK
ncbi:MAG: hypothetical protein WAR78_00310 [Ferruginibacter sp.]|nr:hypothetical protein [Chitinophagaceae bacterium]